MTREPLGIRNNNPGNILWTDRYMWQGQVGKVHENGLNYCVFSDVVYGVRAMTLLLLHLEKYRGANTISALIGLWSKGEPGGDPAYASYVANACDVSATDVIDLHEHAMSIIKGIIHYENGEQPYPDVKISRGIAAAHAW